MTPVGQSYYRRNPCEHRGAKPTIERGQLCICRGMPIDVRSCDKRTKCVAFEHLSDMMDYGICSKCEERKWN